MNIKTIAFDWMHRCGKGSQIKLLRNKLDNVNINNIWVRWEYYRTWNGENNLEDPKSDWWKENIYNTNYEEKSNRLNRELYILNKRKYPEYLRNNNIKQWFIIQDRSIVGNYLFKAWENNSVEGIDYFNYWINNRLINKIIIPDLIFILQPPKEILLQRLYNGYNINEDNAEWRLKYKEKYISEKYESYYSWINNIPEYIKKNIVLILWSHEKQEIHDTVWSTLNKRNICTI